MLRNSELAFVSLQGLLGYKRIPGSHETSNYSLSCSLRVMSLPVSSNVSQTVTPWGGAHALYGRRWRNFRYNKMIIKRHHSENGLQR